MDVCIRRNLGQDFVETECIQWLLLLLQLIEFTDDKARTLIEQFLKSKSKVVKMKSCHQSIIHYVSAQIHLVCNVCLTSHLIFDNSSLLR